MTVHRSSFGHSHRQDPTGYDRLTDDAVALIDGICDEFERLWREGQSPAIETFLDRAPSETRLVLLQELLLIELPYFRRQGGQLTVDAYQKRFPDLDRGWLANALVSTVDASQSDCVAACRPTVLPSIPGYEVLEEIGRGSMGIVYRAIQSRLNRFVAIKMLPVLSPNQSALRARFRSEVEAVAKLHHVGIIQIFDVGQVADVPFYSMEYVGGGSLSELLKVRPLSPRVAAKIVASLAEAIHYAHAQGIVHRDLKPENVLLQSAGAEHGGIRFSDEFDACLTRVEVGDTAESSDPRNKTWLPKITDFGLAKRVDSSSHLTIDGALLGTPSYMAPEQTGLSPVAVTGACDIYGLGAILYCALVGRPPFCAATIVDTIQLVRNVEPVPPSSIQPGVPRDLETICLKCLAKNPDHRFVSAQELADDLNRFLSRQPIHSRPISAFTRLRLWRERNPSIANLLAAFVATILTGLMCSTWLWLRAEHSALLLSRERDKVSRERVRAQHHLDRSRDAVDEMVSMGEVLLRTPGKEQEGRDALRKLVEYCEGFLGDESDDPTIRYQTAIACMRLGRVNNLLGQSHAADLAFQRSRELLHLLKIDDPNEAKFSVGLAQALTDHASLLRNMVRPLESREAYRLAIQEWEQIVASGDASGQWKISLANAIANSVLVRDPSKDGVELRRSLHYGIRLVEEAMQVEPQNRDWMVERIILLESLGNLHLTMGETRECELILEQVVNLWTEFNPGDGERNARYRRALTHMLMGRLFTATNRANQAEDSFRESVSQLTELCGSASCPQFMQLSLLDAKHLLAGTLDRNVDIVEIRSLHRSACVLAALIDKHCDPPSHYVRLRHANVLLNCVVVLDPVSDEREIERCFETALAKIREVLAVEPNNLAALQEYALALDDQGMHKFRKEDYAQAESLVATAREIRDQVADQIGPGEIDYYRSRSRANLSTIYRASGKLRPSCEFMSESIELLEQLSKAQPHNLTYRVTLLDHRTRMVGLLRAAEEPLQAWRCKLAAYLDYNAMVRIPGSPELSSDYLVYPTQLAEEGKKYPGAAEELVEELLKETRRFDEWSERVESVTNAVRVAIIYRRAGSVLAEFDKSTEVLRLFRRASVLDPHNDEARNNVAWWLANSPILSERDPREAVALGKSLVESKPDVAHFRNTLALAYIREGNWAEAQSHLARVQQVRKGNWYDMALEAMIRIHFGDHELANKLLASVDDPDSNGTPRVPQTYQARLMLSDLKALVP